MMVAKVLKGQLSEMFWSNARLCIGLYSAADTLVCFAFFSPSMLQILTFSLPLQRYPTERPYFIAKEILMTERAYKKDLEILNVVSLTTSIDQPTLVTDQLSIINSSLISEGAAASLFCLCSGFGTRWRRRRSRGTRCCRRRCSRCCSSTSTPSTKCTADCSRRSSREWPLGEWEGEKERRLFD